MDQAPMQQPAIPTGRQAAQSGQTNNPLANLPGERKMNKLIIVIVVVIGIVVISLITFRFAKQTGLSVTLRSQEGNYESPKVEAVGDFGSIQQGQYLAPPTGWPNDAPIMTGANIIEASVVKGRDSSDGLLGHVINYKINSSVDNIVTYYKRELVAQSWQVDAPIEEYGNTFLVGNKSERKINIKVWPQSPSGETQVDIGVNKQ